MRYSSRFFLYLPVAVVVLLFAAAAIYWHYAAQALAQRLDALNGHAVAPGVTLRFSSKDVGGFPFRLDAVLENVSIEVARGRGPVRWQAEHFAAHALSYSPSQILFEAAGKQRLSWMSQNGEPHEFRFETGSTHASVVLREGRVARFDLDIVAARWEGGDAARLQFHTRHDPHTDTLDVVSSGDLIHPEASPLGKEIRSARLEGRFVKAGALDPPLAGHQDWRAALTRWRDAGGAFAIDKLEAAASGADVAANGSLKLDAYNRPEGALRTKMKLHPFSLAVPAITTGDIGNILLALTQLALSAGKLELTAPLTLKDGVARVSGLPVADVDPLY